MSGPARTAYRTRVEWMDTDAAGHHHNSAIERFVESAEAQLMRELGIAAYFGAAPRVHHEVDYTARLWFEQEVTCELRVERVGTSSLTFTYEVWGEPFGGRERELAARGRYVTVHVPPGADTAQPWPQPWRAALAAPTGAPPRRDSAQ